MKKRFALFLALIFLTTVLSGCMLLLAGAAGGAGTAVWLSGKLVEEENVSFLRSYDAAKAALASFRYPVEKDTIRTNVAQIIAKHTDGRTIWVDIHRITDVRSRIDVRVGARSDQDAARVLLERIKRNL